MALSIDFIGLDTMRAQQVVDNLVDALPDFGVLRLNDHVRFARRLVGGAESSEMCDFAATGALVETLGIAHFADIQWCVDENFNEGCAACNLPRAFAMLGGRGDGRGDGDEACTAKKYGDVSDAPQIFGSIGLAEAKVGVQPVSEHVTVEQY
jgi:hypothetical protein